MSRKDFAVIIKPLCDIYGEPKNWEAKIGIYFEALCDMPEHTLDSAVKQCVRASEFFPKPAELRQAVRDELEHMHRPALPAYVPEPGESLEEIAERRRQLAPLFSEVRRAMGEPERQQ